MLDYAHPADLASITERERAILQLIADGLTDREIAQRLAIAHGTVKWYNKRIYSKLAVANRFQAAARAKDLGLLDPDFDRLAQPALPQTNLPAPVTPFVGRERELAELASLLADPDARLLTILGPGGMGKTRLALEAAGAQRRNFAKGVYLVELAPLQVAEFNWSTVSDFIVWAIANTIGVAFYGDAEPQQQLLDFLREKSLLLLLDNCENVLDGVAIVSAILAHAPRVKIIATSRERLNLRGEAVIPLVGLDYPLDGFEDGFLQYSALRLFHQTGRRARPDFAPTADEWDAVAHICHLLQGMPLGIELAASWVKALALEEIMLEIVQDLDFLATDLEDMPPRLRSIRAIFESSWEKLSARQREVFMQLSVCRGGFTREAARAVTGAQLRTLSALVDKSLLHHTPDGRYTTQELLRQYAEEYLEASDQSETARDTHSAYFLAFVAEREAKIKGPGQFEAIEQLEADFDNIRAAWTWALRRGDYVAVGKGLHCLFWFFIWKSRLHEGEAFFRETEDQLARLSHNQARVVRALAVACRARMFMLQSSISQRDTQFRPLLAELEDNLAVAREHGRPADVAFCLCICCNLSPYLDVLRIFSFGEESLALYRELGDDFYAAYLFMFLGYNYGVCDRSFKSIRYNLESMALKRKIGDRLGLTWPLRIHEHLLIQLGRYAEAEVSVQERHDILQQLGPSVGLAQALASLGLVAAYNRADLQTAKVLGQKALRMAADLNNSESKAHALELLGWYACVAGDYAAARPYFEDSYHHSYSSSSQLAAIRGLALVAWGRGDAESATEHLQKTFQFSQSLHGKFGVLLILLVAAYLRAIRGEHERAVEAIAPAFTHRASPKAMMDMWPLPNQLRDQLQAELEPAVFEAAWQRGKTLDLETVLEQLQAEFGA